MCTLVQFIVIQRAMEALKKMLENNTSFIGLNNETVPFNDVYNQMLIEDSCTDIQKINRQKKFIELLDALFPGSKVTKIVVANPDDELKQIDQVPLFLLEIYEPIYSIIPLIITKTDIIAVSFVPGNDLFKQTAGNYYAMPVMNTYNICNDNLSVADAIKSLVHTGNNEELKNIQRRILHIFTTRQYITSLNVLLRLFGTMPAIHANLISNESALFTKISRLFELDEELLPSYEDDGPVIEPIKEADYIGKTNFMPIFLKSERGLVFVDRQIDSEKNLRSVIQVHAMPENSKENIIWNNRISGGNNVIESNVVLSTPNNENDIPAIIVLAEDMYYTSLNTCSILNLNANSIVGSFKVTDRFLPDPYIDIDIATEGVLEEAKIMLKDFGIRSTSIATQFVKTIFALPTKLAKKIWSDFKELFRSQKTIEKELTLEYQEKMLNDEIDRLQEMYNGWLNTAIKGFVTSVALMPNIFGFFLSTLVWRSINKETRKRALKKLENKMRGILELIEDDIKNAESEQDSIAVKEAKIKRHAYRQALAEVAKLRTDFYNDPLLERILNFTKTSNYIKSIENGADDLPAINF